MAGPDWTHEALLADDGYRDTPELSELIDYIWVGHALDADLPVSRVDFGGWDPALDLGEDGAEW